MVKLVRTAVLSPPQDLALLLFTTACSYNRTPVPHPPYHYEASMMTKSEKNPRQGTLGARCMTSFHNRHVCPNGTMEDGVFQRY